MTAAACVAALPAAAHEVRFDPVSLPVEHVYSGGWEHFVGGGVAVFDCNGDRYPDLFAAGGAAPARLMVNATAETGALGFADGGVGPEGATGAYPLDIDGDGHMDLAILRVGETLLWRGRGDCTFEAANGLWGFDGGDRWTASFAATWEAGQDRPTLAFGNYVDRDDPEGPFGACDVNELHRPVGDAYTVTELSPGFCALSMLISDWARTGRADLRISNDRHYYVRDGREQMWRLDTLTELGGADWPRISIWGMGIASRDLTGDGLPEVMLTSMGDQLLKIARPGGRYDPAPFEMGATAHRPHTGDDGRPSTGWHAEFADVDNDGDDDLFIAKGNVDQMPGNAAKDPNNLLLQGPDGSFAEAASEAGVASPARSRGAALADLDLDGRVDLVVVNRRAPMELYRNVTEGAGGHLLLAVEAPGPNRQGVGAWIEVRLPDGRVLSREVTVGGGHAGGQAGYHHVGLGDAGTAEVRVTQPGVLPGPWVAVAAATRGHLDLTGPAPRLVRH
ncbi:VCBS repeat-containing protein [Rhodobacteraceae bacterium CCMM004]|nr:VCBS repeat-containing protein [Rhodobacteraceae bacterium CCMM004]